MSSRPWSTKRVRIVPDLSDADLYGAWGMVPSGGMLVDHTPQGNDGTPGIASVIENTILGRMRRYLPNSGAVATALGAANAFRLSDLTVTQWFRQDTNAGSSAWMINYWLNVNDSWGVFVTNTGNIRIFDDIDSAGATRYATNTVMGKLHRVDAVMSRSENLLYLDSVLIGSGESSSDTWDSFAGNLYHGGRTATLSPFEGIVGPTLIYNDAKTQAWISNDYLREALATQWKSDWGVTQSVANETTGTVGFNSSPVEIVSGTWQMSTDTIAGHPVKVLECVAAGIIAIPATLFLATPTERAYGTWGWWGKKADASVLTVGFISTDQTVAANGYNVAWAADESVVIAEAGVGNVVTGGTASADAWHWFNVTRRFDDLFEGFIDGTSFGTGTDATVTTSDYLVFDMDAGDMISWSDRSGDHCIAKYLGVIL